MRDLWNIHAGVQTNEARKFTKMEAMQRVYGEKAGYVVHVLTYSVLPIVLGIVTLVLYLVYGVAVFTSRDPGSLLG